MAWTKERQWSRHSTPKDAGSRGGAGKGLTLVAIVVALVLGLAAGGFATNKIAQALSLGPYEETTNTQVVESIQMKEDVVLMTLAIQGIESKEVGKKINGWKVPGTGKVAYMQYKYRAQLGVDGSKVDVKKTGDKAYTLTVPEFTFMGMQDPVYDMIVEDGGALSFVTPDVDATEMVNNIVTDSVKTQHVTDNTDLLKKQCEEFYNGIVHAIDPEITLTFAYAEPSQPTADATATEKAAS